MLKDKKSNREIEKLVKNAKKGAFKGIKARKRKTK